MTINQNSCSEKSIVSLIDRLDAGIELPGGFLYAKTIEQGRLKEERTLNLYLRQCDDENPIMRATVFTGRAEFFKPWIELSHIQNRFILNGKTLVYIDSDLEIMVYHLLSEAISTGGKIFVEYGNDPETRIGLHAGVPAPATRIGYLLFQSGITGFGGFSCTGEMKKEKQTLQGAKAISCNTRNRHLNAIESQINSFLGSVPWKANSVIDRAMKRSQAILESIVPQKMAS